MSAHPLHATVAPLRPYKEAMDTSLIVSEVKKVWHLLRRSKHWREVQRELRRACDDSSLRASSLSLEGDAITAVLSQEADYNLLTQVCESLISWRTGPYHLGGFNLDAEWLSYKKWGRVAPLLPRRSGMRIADVGCSNGYFLYKLSTLSPEIAVGFDPIERCWLQFALLQSILRVPNLACLPMGLLTLNAFPKFFDLIVCMGVIYHQRDQALAVRRLHEATKVGGQVLLESLVVPTEEPLTITPPDRYAKMRNAWTIPSAAYLGTLFEQAGFKDISVHSFGPLSIQEQRQTQLAPFESLADFLDPNDPSRTVEGHPAPHTAVAIGTR